MSSLCRSCLFSSTSPSIRRLPPSPLPPSASCSRREDFLRFEFGAASSGLRVGRHPQLVWGGRGEESRREGGGLPSGRDSWRLAVARNVMAATETFEVAVGGRGGVRVEVYPDMKDLSVGLAEYIKNISTESISKKSAFTLVLSGGSLVKALAALADPKFMDELDWARWHIFWADERVVPLSSPDSNYKAAFEEFLSKVPIPPGQVYSINELLSAEGAASDYETNLRHLTKVGVLSTTSDGTYPRFDIILLGMGPDGHVASLFPHHPLLQEKTKWVAHITDSPKPPPERITLTSPAINAAANIGFVAVGGGKTEQLKLVFGPPVAEGSLPAQKVYPEEGTLVWFIDEPAAKGLRD